MGILEKLNMLELAEEERVKAQEKFLATLALVSDTELNDIVGYLNSEGVKITKAKEIKVLGNAKEEILKKFSILGEIHETNIYRQDPTLINHNVIDIYKKIKYCNQMGRPYKTELGEYEPFLFSELLWQQEFNRDFKAEAPTHLEETKKSEKPALEQETHEVYETSPVVENKPSFEEPLENSSPDFEHIDIQEYMKNTDDSAELEAKTTDFATVRRELEASLKELDSLKSLSDDSFEEISFNDLEPESYGTRRAA